MKKYLFALFVAVVLAAGAIINACSSSDAAAPVFPTSLGFAQPAGVK